MHRNALIGAGLLAAALALGPGPAASAILPEAVRVRPTDIAIAPIGGDTAFGGRSSLRLAVQLQQRLQRDYCGKALDDCMTGVVISVLGPDDPIPAKGIVMEGTAIFVGPQNQLNLGGFSVPMPILVFAPPVKQVVSPDRISVQPILTVKGEGGVLASWRVALDGQDVVLPFGAPSVLFPPSEYLKGHSRPIIACDEPSSACPGSRAVSGALIIESVQGAWVRVRLSGENKSAWILEPFNRLAATDAEDFAVGLLAYRNGDMPRAADIFHRLRLNSDSAGIRFEAARLEFAARSQAGEDMGAHIAFIRKEHPESETFARLQIMDRLLVLSRAQTPEDRAVALQAARETAASLAPLLSANDAWTAGMQAALSDSASAVADATPPSPQVASDSGPSPASLESSQAPRAAPDS